MSDGLDNRGKFMSDGHNHRAMLYAAW
jgi:hypothetical protein